MGIKGRIFEPKGITRKSIDYRGKVVVSPAKIHARQPLKPLAETLTFILPHILYDYDLGVDPVREYAHAGSQDIPVMYWDADYPLVVGLRKESVAGHANRIYGVLNEDAVGILKAATAVIAINPQTGKSVRLEYTKLRIVDPFLPRTGSLTLDDVTIEVVAWILQWSDRLTTMLPHQQLHGIATKLIVSSSPLSSPGLSQIAKVITDGDTKTEEAITKALDTTVLDNHADTADRDSEG